MIKLHLHQLALMTSKMVLEIQILSIHDADCLDKAFKASCSRQEMEAAQRREAAEDYHALGMVLLTFKLPPKVCLYLHFSVVLDLEVEVWCILQLALEHIPILAHEVACNCAAQLTRFLIFNGTRVVVDEPPKLRRALIVEDKATLPIKIVLLLLTLQAGTDIY